ncbi:MAG: outer membrane protein transport protein, partial [Candidatus Omnitrophota bacterium]
VDKLKLEFNLDWTYWKPFESIIVDYTPPSMEDVDIRYDYHNTCAYKFGVEYLLTDSLALRGGYIYNESATPERNWRPSVPDSDMHFFSFGTGYKIGGFTFDSAVLLIYYKDITINNNVGNNETTTASSIDGKYKSLALEFSLGATYKF